MIVRKKWDSGVKPQAQSQAYNRNSISNKCSLPLYLIGVIARVKVNFNSRDMTEAFWGLNKDLMKNLVDKRFFFFLECLHGWIWVGRCISREIRQDGQEARWAELQVPQKAFQGSRGGRKWASLRMLGHEAPAGMPDDDAPVVESSAHRDKPQLGYLAIVWA